MNVVVTAPVAERAWALPDWYRHLAAQTTPPTEIVLLHSGRKEDDTWETIERCALEYGITTHRMHDTSIPHQRHDNTRFVTLARLRNQLLATARLVTDSPFVFSLDTDVMLEDPTTIEKLRGAAEIYGCASPLTYLHPDMEWTVNAGMLLEAQQIENADPGVISVEEFERWPWTRAEPTHAALAGVAVQPIDIPMAAIMMRRDVYTTTRYARHESGEDIAFAISMKRKGHRAVWLPSIEARHVWDETRL